MVAPSSDPTVSRCSSFTFASLRNPQNPPQGVAKVPVKVIGGRAKKSGLGGLFGASRMWTPVWEDRHRGPPLLTASRG